MSLRIMACLITLFSITGCASDNMGDLQKYVGEIKAREPTPIEPLPEIKQVETFVYVGGDRRDPFLMGQQAIQETVVEQNSGIAGPNLARAKEELEQYPLDSLRMVGTLEQAGTFWGLVSVKDGTLFRVRSGNYMGQNHGQITRVGEERIELTEIIPDNSGGWQERQTAVALSE